MHNHLLRLQYSPIAALNRTYALSKVKGKEAAIKAAEKLQLMGNHYYYVLLGELYSSVDNKKAKANFEQALSLAKTAPDRLIIQKKLARFFE